VEHLREDPNAMQPIGRFHCFHVAHGAVDPGWAARPFLSSQWTCQSGLKQREMAMIAILCSTGCTSRSWKHPKPLRAKLRSFFSEWTSWLEDSFIPKLDLVEEDLPTKFAIRTGVAPPQTANGKSTDANNSGQATISSRVWVAKDPLGAVRRLRLVEVDAGGQLQAFNAVVYPSCRLGLQPVLGVDVLSFNSHKRLLFGVDWAPMLRDPDYLKARIARFVRKTYEEFDELRTAPSGKIYGDDPEFFSPYMFLSRPEGKEAISADSKLWKVFNQYFNEYCTMLVQCPKDADQHLCLQAQERQAAYDAWHAERDPAVKVFRRMFGEEWTEEFTQAVLFPGSAARPPKLRELGQMESQKS